MDEYRSVWGRPEGPTWILAIAAGVAVLQVLVVLLFAISSLPAALAVPLVVLLGPAAAWGVAFGAAFADLFAVGPGVESVVSFVDVFVCAVLGRALWELLPSDRRRFWPATLAIVPVALTATVVGGGLAAVGATLFSNARFATIIPGLLAERAVLTAIVAPVVLAVGLGRMDAAPSCPGTSVRRWLGTVTVVAAIAVAWLIGTTVFSLTREDVRAIDPLSEGIRSWAPGVLEPVVAFTIGPHGWLLHLVGAAGFVALVALVIRMGHRPTASGR